MLQARLDHTFQNCRRPNWSFTSPKCDPITVCDAQIHISAVSQTFWTIWHCSNPCLMLLFISREAHHMTVWLAFIVPTTTECSTLFRHYSWDHKEKIVTKTWNYLSLYVCAINSISFRIWQKPVSSQTRKLSVQNYKISK